MRAFLLSMLALGAAVLTLWPQAISRAEMVECVEFTPRNINGKSGLLATSQCAMPKLANACLRLAGEINTLQQGASLRPGGSWFFEQFNPDGKEQRYSMAVCTPSPATTRMDICMPRCPAQFADRRVSGRLGGGPGSSGTALTPAAPLDPGAWITESDYPSSALREEREGATGFMISVLPSGAVGSCQITSSSGSPDLDAATCRLVQERGRFRPARDAAGRPVTSNWSSRIRWVIPADIPPPAGP